MNPEGEFPTLGAFERQPLTSRTQAGNVGFNVGMVDLGGSTLSRRVLLSWAIRENLNVVIIHNVSNEYNGMLLDGTPGVNSFESNRQGPLTTKILTTQSFAVPPKRDSSHLSEGSNFRYLALEFDGAMIGSITGIPIRNQKRRLLDDRREMVDSFIAEFMDGLRCPAPLWSVSFGSAFLSSDFSNPETSLREVYCNEDADRLFSTLRNMGFVDLFEASGNCEFLYTHWELEPEGQSKPCGIREGTFFMDPAFPLKFKRLRSDLWFRENKSIDITAALIAEFE